MLIGRFILVGLALVLFRNTGCAGTADDLSSSLKVIRAVGPEGRGNTEASLAWKTVATARITSVPGVLTAMDGANELAANWLRAAVDTIVSRETAVGARLPTAELKAFLADPRHHPRARRLAFELIRRDDPAAANKLLAGMLGDPSLELRRDAVQNVIDGAKKTLDAGDKATASAHYRQALRFARDLDQIDGVSKKLGELGEKVDLPALFGWITRWKVIGPFDSTGGKGFEAAYPPETKFDLLSENDGKSGTVKWNDWVTTNDYGMVDLNKPLGKLKGVAGYARAEFVSDRAQPVELRLGTENAWKVWLNGELLFGREEYHRAAEIDQYRLPGQLRSGRNHILVKLCQNEQTEDWADGWEFQMRVTDALGTPIESSSTAIEAGRSLRQPKETP